MSENIEVRCVVDRFLEHARIFLFENGGASTEGTGREIFCASADWMPRNFRRRVEVMFPILDPAIQRRIASEILDTMRADNVKGWILCEDGTYRRVAPSGDETRVRSQKRFMDIARDRAHEVEHPSFGHSVVPGPPGIDQLQGKRKRKRKKPKRKKQKYI